MYEVTRRSVHFFQSLCLRAPHATRPGFLFCFASFLCLNPEYCMKNPKITNSCCDERREGKRCAWHYAALFPAFKSNFPFATLKLLELEIRRRLKLCNCISVVCIWRASVLVQMDSFSLPACLPLLKPRKQILLNMSKALAEDSGRRVTIRLGKIIDPCFAPSHLINPHQMRQASCI